MTLFQSPKDFPLSAALKRLIATIIQAGGKPIAVGGCVRDFLLGITPKDIDVEVYNISADTLEQTLKQIGAIYAVGKSFGVLKVVVDDKVTEEQHTFDVSLPRTENKQGRGHRGFLVTPDPNLSFETASSRRDFTINAMGIDLSSMQLLDAHNGLQDLENKILRHVSGAFSEDPLRVLRGAQFAARFELTLAPETVHECRKLCPELTTLPKERLWAEIYKLMHARYPSVGLNVLRETQALSLFPELEALIGCQQDPTWHPEGDVWIHTGMVADQAAYVVRRENLPEHERTCVMFGALCHDLGKPPTTKWEDGRWRSKNHEAAGEAPTRSFLSRIGAPLDLIEDVVPLVRDHLKPVQLYKERDKISDTAVRRLATRVNIQRLCHVAEADFLGRTTAEALLGFDPSVHWLKEQAKRLQVSDQAPKPILQGRHLIEHGIEPGTKMGRILQHAFQAQLEGEFNTLEEAQTWLREQLAQGRL